MSAILSVFVIGAVGWWCLTILFVIYVFFALDRDYDNVGEHSHLFWPVFMLILYIVFMQFIAKADIFNFSIHHPLDLLLYVLGYFVTGFAWSFVKWWLFVNTLADKYRVRKDDFLSNFTTHESAVPRAYRGSPDDRTEQQREWEDIVRREHLQKPVATKYKGRITVWVMYWPISVIWSLLDDFVKKLVRHIVTMFQKFYQFISDSAFKKFEKDITN
jgi:hypothetical protein